MSDKIRKPSVYTARSFSPEFGVYSAVEMEMYLHGLGVEIQELKDCLLAMQVEMKRVGEHLIKIGSLREFEKLDSVLCQSHPVESDYKIKMSELESENKKLREALIILRDDAYEYGFLLPESHSVFAVLDGDNPV